MDFTNEEKERINQLYGNDFADITPDDAQLIARWESWKATQESEHMAKLQAFETEAQAKVEDSKRLSDKAMENLEELKNAALARLERLG